MATGFGVDGTSTEDIQRITNALYTPGVISGAIVIPSTTGLTYSVSQGVICIEMAPGLNVLAPVPSGTVPATAGGTDTIYASHTADNDVLPQVVSNGTPPTGSVVLDRFIVPAGATKASSASRTGNVDYSIPYGTNGHSLWYYSYSHNGSLSEINLTTTGKFFVPTDRVVDVSCLGTFDTVGGEGSVYFNVEFDGVTVTNMGTGKLSNWYTTHYLLDTLSVDAGEHTVRITISASGDLSAVYMRTGGEATKRPGLKYKIRDAGVAV